MANILQFTSPLGSLNASLLPPEEFLSPGAHGPWHGGFLKGGRMGWYRDLPQFVWHCMVCKKRWCLRTISSMLKSREVHCGCAKGWDPRCRCEGCSSAG